MDGGRWDEAVGDSIFSVSGEEVSDLLERPRERWKDPQPIPGWFCDGVHSAGNDVRFMRTWHHMYAVSRAFQHYGRLDPGDIWLPEFRCYDGLTIEPVEETSAINCKDRGRMNKATN